ncbi:MAG: 2-C-methyl-D-erythritol 2,4-cyclodiphosphate synthase [Planctomycetes bacterium]|jgi:2-C-methyl-D-erythritol 2,4-cyclodiphosphate synthase|nr:2-C-methyl-D-erythritol 2,4-cyclodiphosphate synthase [Planctomycetota bacterium]MCL4730403.1 2-C-methyl-D-erythritol 2,4-cyclodiphosphate synthase [Planctomycetota bacterium]
MRVGIGYDIHALAEGRKLMLGGVHVPHERGCVGHSDGDPLLHAIIDALLGAAGLGDIGEHFPDTDRKYKDADSAVLLKHAVGLVRRRGWEVENVDCNVIAQAPRLKPYKHQMESRIATLLELDTDRVNVKAKTNEGFDAVGRKDAIATQAVVLLKRARASRAEREA